MPGIVPAANETDPEVLARAIRHLAETGFDLSILNAISSLATDDTFPFYDTSTGLNAKVTLADLTAAIPTSASAPSRVINGRFEVDQRNVGVATVVADASYGPDLWKMLGEDSLGKLTAKDTTVGGGRFNCAVTCVTANNKYGIVQYIEGINCKDLRGKTVTLSANLSVSNARLGNIKMGIVEWTGTEDTITSDMISAWGADGVTPTLAASFAFKNTPANLTVTTTPTSYSVSATLGSTFTNLAVFIWGDDKAFNANDVIYVTDVQLVEGSTVPTFTKRLYSEVLSSCMRYYQSLTGRPLGVFDTVANTNVYGTSVTLGTPMRVAPFSVVANLVAVFNFPASFSYTESAPTNLHFEATANGSGQGYFIYSLTASADL